MTWPGESTCAIVARGLRGASLGFLKVFSNLSDARLLIPLEVIRSLWFLAKERTKSGEYVVAVVPRVAESRKARLSPRALSDRNYEIRQR